MLLYKVPRNTWIKVEDIEDPILFHHIDGMYSYCTIPEKGVIHLNAMTKVDIVNIGELNGNRSAGTT